MKSVNYSQAVTDVTLDETHLATKADLRAAVSDLRAEMADLRSDLLKWGIGILFTGLALQAGLLLVMVNRFAR